MSLVLRSGLRLNFRQTGNGLPVVLLHPVGMRLEFWDGVIERLAKDHRVIAVDTRGHGSSGVSDAPFSLDGLASDVIELLETIKAAPAILVGCSMGGMLAMGAALLAPQLVSGLVLGNTNHAIDDNGRAVMRQRAQAVREDFPATIAPTIERWFSPAFRSAHPSRVQEVQEWLRANDPEIVAKSWEAIAGLNYGERLENVACPVVALAGELDPASPPATMKRVAAAFPRGVYHEIAGAGHFAPIERPDAFVDAVREVEALAAPV